MTDDRPHATEDELFGTEDAESITDLADDEFRSLMDAGAFETDADRRADEGEAERPDGELTSHVNDRNGWWCCRFCQSSFTSRKSFSDHQYRCEEWQAWHRARERERETERKQEATTEIDGETEADLEDIDEPTQADTSLDENRLTATPGDADADAEERLRIKPAPHEFSAYIKYACGLDPYFGLNSLQKEWNWEDGQPVTGFVDDDGQKWEATLTFSESGLKPRNHRNFQLQTVREYRVKIHPPGEEHGSATRKATFHVRPRWPDMESKGDSPNPSNPHDLLGLDVATDGSGIWFDRYPRLFDLSLQALRCLQGTNYASPTFIATSEIGPNHVHHSTNITDAELYVRVQKNRTRNVYALDGPLHRISLLLADEREGFAMSKRDDTECEGYYHTAQIGDWRAAELIGTHRLGKEFKHYHMKNPSAVEDDPVLSNPKIGASFQHSRTDGTVFWEDLPRLERELDESLLSILNAAGIPLQPDDSVYVEDDVFEVEGERRTRIVLDDEQLPQIAAEQNETVEIAMENMAPTDAEVTETMLADGGTVSPQQLAEQTGRNIHTIYRTLDRLEGFVRHEYGEVKFASQHVAQKALQKIKSAKQAVDANLDGAISDMMDAHRLEDDTSAWGRLANTYGIELSDAEDAFYKLLRMGYTPANEREAEDIVRQAAFAHPVVNIMDFGDDVRGTIECANGAQFPVESAFG
ncbi:hypothetical protein [Halarchaeum salinum]|uniref:DUF7845 domain-containing protein n=1 Tax=Halarchaeum salinum TaxID=489912 RepID=A0AAV3S577_9EURY